MYSKLDRERILEDVKDVTPPIFFWDKIIINLISDIDHLEKELAAVPSEEEMKLRKLLWLNHGCPRHRLYGDDGEMQCSQCGLDFKRETADALERGIAG